MRTAATPRIAAVLSLALVLALAGPAPGATLHIVNQFDTSFIPDSLWIAPGDTVRWVQTNYGLHTITSGKGSYDPEMGNLFDGVITEFVKTWEFVFDLPPDIYPYFCIPHEPMDMLGWIIVEAPTGASPTPSPPALTLRVYPNPFTTSTTIAYTLRDAADVHLRVYDVRGRVVTTLDNAPRSQGDHTATWDGRDAHGTPVPSGVYFCRLETAASATSRRILLLK